MEENTATTNNEDSKLFNIYQEALGEKIKNTVCPSCGSSHRILMGDGVILRIVSKNSSEIVEDLGISVVCANCGMINTYLSTVLLGNEKNEQVISIMKERLEKNSKEVNK